MTHITDYTPLKPDDLGSRWMLLSESKMRKQCFMLTYYNNHNSQQPQHGRSSVPFLSDEVEIEISAGRALGVLAIGPSVCRCRGIRLAETREGEGKGDERRRGAQRCVCVDPIFLVPKQACDCQVGGQSRTCAYACELLRTRRPEPRPIQMYMKSHSWYVLAISRLVGSAWWYNAVCRILKRILYRSHAWIALIYHYHYISQAHEHEYFHAAL